MDFIDLSGKQFGRLTAIKRAENKKGKTAWLCRCSCGNEKMISAECLTRGKTNSCGCLRVDRAKQRETTHGLSQHRLYEIWRGMLNRCYKADLENYKYYGGRGIKVCDEWHDFLDFYTWAIGNGYTEGLTIERKDVNGNYEPNNCCWITRKEQTLNKTTSCFITINGVTKTLKEWSDCTGLKKQTISKRLKSGKTGEELIKPVG